MIMIERIIEQNFIISMMIKMETSDSVGAFIQKIITLANESLK